MARGSLSECCAAAAATAVASSAPKCSVEGDRHHMARRQRSAALLVGARRRRTRRVSDCKVQKVWVPSEVEPRKEPLSEDAAARRIADAFLTGLALGSGLDCINTKTALPSMAQICTASKAPAMIAPVLQEGLAQPPCTSAQESHKQSTYLRVSRGRKIATCTSGKAIGRVTGSLFGVAGERSAKPPPPPPPPPPPAAASIAVAPVATPRVLHRETKNFGQSAFKRGPPPFAVPVPLRFTSHAKAAELQ